MTAPCTTDCRIIPNEPQETSSRVASLSRKCRHIVEFVEARRRIRDLVTSPTSIGYRFFVAFDTHCAPSGAPESKPVKCDKQISDGVWLFALPDQAGSPTLEFDWHALVAREWQGVLHVTATTPDPTSKLSEIRSAVKHVVHPDYGILLGRPAFRILRCIVKDEAFGAVKITLAVRDAFNDKAKPRQFEAVLPVVIPTALQEQMSLCLESGTTPEWRLVEELKEVKLSEFAVVGSYMRYDEAERVRISSFVGYLRNSLMGSTNGNENYALWAPSGSGKTHLMKELESQMAGSIKFIQANVATDSKEQVEKLVKSIPVNAKMPTLCFFDELDCDQASAWSCEAIFSSFRLNSNSTGQIVTVIAGSRAGGLNEMIRHIKSFRNKGEDLLTRIGQGDGYLLEIPAASKGDLIVMFISNLFAKDKRQVRLRYIDRLALYYLVAASGIQKASAAGDLAAKVVERLEPGAERATIGHMFDRNSHEAQAFFTKHAEAVGKFSDQAIAIGP